MDTNNATLSRKQWLLLSLLAFHFLMICSKSFREYRYVRSVLRHLPALKIASEYYTQLTVLQADYSFFSPNIASDHEVIIETEDSAGIWHNASYVFPNTEVEKRFHTCALALQHLEDSLQDIVVKSWAARTYDEYPNARAIRVRIIRSKVPPMEQFVTGKRKEPEKILEVVFNTH
jgi:hypothetical protein